MHLRLCWFTLKMQRHNITKAAPRHDLSRRWYDLQLNFTAHDSTSDPSDLTVQIGRRNRPSVNRPCDRGHRCPRIIMRAVELLVKEMQKGLFSDACHPWVNSDIRYSSLTNIILIYLTKVHVTCTKCYGWTMWLQNCVVKHTGGLRTDYRSKHTAV